MHRVIYKEGLDLQLAHSWLQNNLHNTSSELQNTNNFVWYK